MNIIRTSNNPWGSIEFVTAVQPKSGGAAPNRPPITIFCDVARLRKYVSTKPYPTHEAKFNHAVNGFTANHRIAKPSPPVIIEREMAP